MNDEDKSCTTCTHKGNAEEMVANRIRVLCGVTGMMVFRKENGECIAWEKEK